MPEPEWVTIAEAARLLSIAPRQARRYADRVAEEDRQPAQGEEPLRVRLSAVQALRAQTEAKKAEDAKRPDGDTGEDTEGTQAGTGGEDSPRDMAGVMSLAYERIIQTKDEQIAQLVAALDHERETTRRLGEALAREQTLRALEHSEQETAAEPSQDAPEASPSHTPDGAARRRWRWPWQPAPPPEDPPT